MPTNGQIIGGIAAGAALILLGGGTAAATGRRREESSGDDSAEADVSGPLPADMGPRPMGSWGAPLGGATRNTTPRGYYGAPRWRWGSSSTGDPAKVPPELKGKPPTGAHAAVDLVAKNGEPVLAVTDGDVVAVYAPGDAAGGACLVGLKLQALADPKVSVIYCDMGRVSVARGARVKRGDVVGYVGRGFVHVAVKVSGVAQDPAKFFPVGGRS